MTEELKEIRDKIQDFTDTYDVTINVCYRIEIKTENGKEVKKKIAQVHANLQV